MDAGESYEVMIIDGDELRLELGELPIEAVDLDDDNARLRHHLWNGKTPEDFIREMRDTPELKESIKSNGGLLEKIFAQPVVGAGRKLGKYRAREGNRRLVCVRDLHQQFPDDPRWATIPARILPADLEPKKLAILLADWHGPIRCKCSCGRGLCSPSPPIQNRSTR
jgi:hypothetical protein